MHWLFSFSVQHLPEQGISGPFTITSIRHILPPKKPVDEDPTDDYAYRPVTALFTHVSNQVYDINFGDSTKLGVTYRHPIYSVTAGDWQLAGGLRPGEKVLTREGDAEVVSVIPRNGVEVVYNLEVKDWHNFLVGECRIVVHNSYFPDAQKLAKVLGVSADKIHDVKRIMIKDWKNDFPHGFGNNPDIGYSDLGELLFKSRVNGGVFNTGFDIANYID